MAKVPMFRGCECVAMCEDVGQSYQVMAHVPPSVGSVSDFRDLTHLFELRVEEESFQRARFSDGYGTWVLFCTDIDAVRVGARAVEQIGCLAMCGAVE